LHCIRLFAAGDRAVHAVSAQPLFFDIIISNIEILQFLFLAQTGARLSRKHGKSQKKRPAPPRGSPVESSLD